jgi:hypothetical protein
MSEVTIWMTNQQQAYKFIMYWYSKAVLGTSREMLIKGFLIWVTGQKNKRKIKKKHQISQVIINVFSCLLQAKKLKRAERFGLQT